MVSNFEVRPVVPGVQHGNRFFLVLAKMFLVPNGTDNNFERLLTCRAMKRFCPGI